jgi:hypothetical protein
MLNLIKLVFLALIGIALLYIDTVIKIPQLKLIASFPFLTVGIYLIILFLFPRLEKRIIG